MKRVVERRFRAPWRHDPWDDSDAAYAIMLERPRKANSHLRWLAYLVLTAVVAGVVAAGMYGMWFVRELNPPGEPSDQHTFAVLASDDLVTLSERLERQGYITNADVFRTYVEHRGGLELTAGDYQIRANGHAGDLLEVFRTPPAQTYTNVTFPEGFTLAKVGDRLTQKVPHLSLADFNLVTTDGSLRSAFQPFGVTTLEGMLFPDTYQVSNSESEAQVVERMIALMERVGRQEDIETKARKLNLTPYQVLIVASIIEREAKLDEDRPRIARVIYNRMYLGLPLQVDATLYYNQDPDTPFSVLKTIDSPYNTYMYAGLPPTPIANPGRASIRAALSPSPNPGQGDPLCVDLADGVPCIYLFYVLINEEGGHAFAATLEQHEANVRRALELGLL